MPTPYRTIAELGERLKTSFRPRATAADKVAKAQSYNRMPDHVLAAMPELDDDIAIGTTYFEELDRDTQRDIAAEIEARKAKMRAVKFRELRGNAGYEPLTRDEMGDWRPPVDD